MRKSVLITSVFVVLTFFTARGQGQVGIGEKQFNAGTGYAGGYVPLYAGVYFGVHRDITIGPKMVLSFYRDSYLDHYNWGDIMYYDRIIDFGGAFVFDYHFNRVLNIPGQFDLYAGSDLGLFGYSSKEIVETWEFDYITTDTYEETGTYINFNLHAGGRYIFPSGLGLNMQMDLDRFNIFGLYFGISKKF